MNRRVRLALRPVGFPKDSDFEIVELPVPEPSEGEVLTRTLYLSLDAWWDPIIRSLE
jgi:NADPH-dependent curcumin reductase CurA